MPATPQTIFVGVIGVGGVGKAFLPQLHHLSQRLSQANPPTDLRLILARRSNKQLFSESWQPLNILNVLRDLDQVTQPLLPLQETVDYLATAPGRVILVDNTSDPTLANAYPSILRKGISVVTPNKKAFSDTYALWSDIFSGAANGTGSADAGYIFHESTVGAGLPVLSTLKELLETGDEVTKIEGVFSGTMSFLFNSFMPVGSGSGGNFSAEVSKAKDLGFTEPDPRDDLNGLDVARKLTILARLAGLAIESPTAFPVESLIPAELETCASGDEFLQKLPEYDGQMDSLKASAAKEGKVIRFVGSIDVPGQKVKVGLEKFDASHPIAALKGSDNIINFYTKRYGSNPLIVQGAGAGGEVTAMGVTGDLLKVVRLLQ
ncbi:homoserine dehydrogenase-like protein [Hortaea werneckii]|uniref:Homoserine dehydrogenase n=1 Tax=Hortaea werneckii TaxID=91943 RepID=A0A3M7HLD7_HORWE|nr:homoserine dehydrogenase-like protein [Hortaea werneckii]KAI7563430.1 homoserine dehydrogenase-like protein [Hortaea werneckii]KAI7619613.1 homoserine dehydrogenase-like protein [Hortaea werneckii]KAI7630181.1 homoserine dehydrogenase-like protein [Hortaea werneckii]KAI7676366.1 homoserine dehydrogenase-like protein [Hortaea werneckii]